MKKESLVICDPKLGKLKRDRIRMILVWTCSDVLLDSCL
jgi:hypothetical protein